MDTKLYKTLIKEYENSEDEYIKKEIKIIIDEIDNLFSVFSTNVTDEDIKIILATNYVLKQKELVYNVNNSYNEDFIKLLEKELEIYKKPFKNLKELEEYSEEDQFSFASVYDANKILKYITKKNGFAIFLEILATLLLLIGFVASIILNDGVLSFFTILYKFIITSIIFYALAGLFELLHEIRRKLYIKF